ncbi:MAG: glycoside hydrolase family 5 protein, partial [Actinobacteria bacterium]|nr:glycoside hydrolase family 5 protein [Actinomycetota bacterium]
MKRFRSVAMLLAAAVLAAGCSGASDSTDGDRRDTTNTTAGGSGTSGGDAETEPGAACDGSVESPDVRFIVDDCGRVVILRGVNVESSSKGTAQEGNHLPMSGIDGQAALRNWGWNSVRFLVFWGAIEPEPGRYSEEYLNGVERWLDHYAEQGIRVVLDMHQDLYGWAVGFDGAPDWAVDTQGLESGELDPNQPWYLKGADPAVQAAYQSFWNPKGGQPDLQAKWLAALTHLAERFAEHPAVIGYDVLNEPAFANGDLAATLAIQADAAAGTFRNENLTAFMQGGIEAVRAVDEDAWVFI